LLNDYISAALVEQPEDVFLFARDFFKGVAINVVETGNKDADDEYAGGDDDDDDAMSGGGAGGEQDVDDLDDMIVTESAKDPALTEYLKSVFDHIDVDSSGTISQAELKQKLSNDDELQKLLEAAGGSGDWYVLEQLDADGDGEITWMEFESMLSS